MSERLQKYLARAGVGSRRHCEGLITAGRVKINNARITELGTKVNPGDLVTLDDSLITPAAERVYYLLYKPTGVVTTLEDPQGRPTVKHYLGDIEQRVFPVGRLDYDAEGALLFTDDGELAHKLMHPSFEVPRSYLAKVKGSPDAATLEKLRGGVRLEDGLATPRSVEVFEQAEKNTWIKIVVAEGRPHLIKRLCAAVGHPVVRLFRPSYAGLGVGNLRPGQLRPLTETEVEVLQKVAIGELPAGEDELRLPPRRHGRAAPGFDEDEEGGGEEPIARTLEERPQHSARAPKGEGSGEWSTERPKEPPRRGGVRKLVSAIKARFDQAASPGKRDGGGRVAFAGRPRPERASFGDASHEEEGESEALEAEAGDQRASQAGPKARPERGARPQSAGARSGKSGRPGGFEASGGEERGGEERGARSGGKSFGGERKPGGFEARGGEERGARGGGKSFAGKSFGGERKPGGFGGRGGEERGARGAGKSFGGKSFGGERKPGGFGGRGGEERGARGAGKSFGGKSFGGERKPGGFGGRGGEERGARGPGKSFGGERKPGGFGARGGAPRGERGEGGGSLAGRGPGGGFKPRGAFAGRGEGAGASERRGPPGRMGGEGGRSADRGAERGGKGRFASRGGEGRSFGAKPAFGKRSFGDAPGKRAAGPRGEGRGSGERGAERRGPGGGEGRGFAGKGKGSFGPRTGAGRFGAGGGKGKFAGPKRPGAGGAGGPRSGPPGGRRSR